MSQGRCSRCFKMRDLQVVLPETEPVCRGCFSEVDAAVGWLSWQGYGVLQLETGQLIGPQSQTPPTPPDAVEDDLDTQPDLAHKKTRIPG